MVRRVGRHATSVPGRRHAEALQRRSISRAPVSFWALHARSLAA